MSETQPRAVSVLSVFHTVVSHWKWTIVAPFVGAIAMALLSFALSPIYTSTARFLPPQSQSSQALMAALANSPTALGSLFSGLGLKNPGDLYVGLARSNTVADRIIEKFQLKSVYKEDTQHDTRKELNERVAVSSNKEGIVTIEVEDRDPKRAADIGNSYLLEIAQLLSEMNASEATQRRQFFTGQLQAAQSQLAQSEVDLRSTQERTGLLAIDEQARLIIENIARLRAQISAGNVELEGMRLYSTPSNPEFQKRAVALRELEKELRRLEVKEGTPGDVLVASGRLPEVGMQYLRNLRNLKYHEALAEILYRQYELARLEEARQQVSLHVIDRATIPDKRTRPKRALIALITFFALFVSAIGACYLVESFRLWMSDPTENQRWMALKTLLKRKHTTT